MPIFPLSLSLRQILAFPTFADLFKYKEGLRFTPTDAIYSVHCHRSFLLIILVLDNALVSHMTIACVNVGSGHRYPNSQKSIDEVVNGINSGDN